MFLHQATPLVFTPRAVLLQLASSVWLAGIRDMACKSALSVRIPRQLQVVWTLSRSSRGVEISETPAMYLGLALLLSRASPPNRSLFGHAHPFTFRESYTSLPRFHVCLSLLTSRFDNMPDKKPSLWEDLAFSGEGRSA